MRVCGRYISTDAVLRVLLISLFTLLASASGLPAGANQFVILSDIHPSGPDDPQLPQLIAEMKGISPEFVVFLGDDLHRGGVLETLQAIRDAGIEVHAAFGNHDPIFMRRKFFAHTPPMNSITDMSDFATYRRVRVDRKHYYSFVRGGIHFVILDGTNGMHNKDLREDAQLDWMEDVLGRHVGNPNRCPTLVFVHYPEWMTGDRGCESRPIYRVLEKHPEHTVGAVFGGHWHRGQNFPPEDNLGVQVYATEITVLSEKHRHDYGEYLVATVEPERIVFDKRALFGRDDCITDIVYHPIRGRFGRLDE